MIGPNLYPSGGRWSAEFKIVKSCALKTGPGGKIPARSALLYLELGFNEAGEFSHDEKY